MFVFKISALKRTQMVRKILLYLMIEADPDFEMPTFEKKGRR
jgi:hypothetical protein